MECVALLTAWTYLLYILLPMWVCVCACAHHTYIQSTYMTNCQGPLKVDHTHTHTHTQTHMHTHTLSPWFVPLPTSSAAYGVSAGVRQCQLPPSASQWGPASRHLSGQLSLLSTLHCTTLCQASAQDPELLTHTPALTRGKSTIVFIVLPCKVRRILSDRGAGLNQLMPSTESTKLQILSC